MFDIIISFTKVYKASKGWFLYFLSAFNDTSKTEDVFQTAPKPFWSSHRIPAYSVHSRMYWFRIEQKALYGTERSDIPLYLSGILGSLVLLFGIGVIIP